MKASVVILAGIFLFSCASRQAIKSESALDAAPTIAFSDDDGSSFHRAVVVSGAKNQREGMAAEHEYISRLHGERGKDWYLVGQTIIREQNKLVDVVEIEMNDSPDRKIFFFDATDFLFKE